MSICNVTFSVFKEAQILCFVCTDIIVMVESTIFKGNAMRLLPRTIQGFNTCDTCRFVIIITTASDKAHWQDGQ